MAEKKGFYFGGKSKERKQRGEDPKFKDLLAKYAGEEEEEENFLTRSEQFSAPNSEPERDLPKISKQVLVYEMQKAGYTDLDIREQTGLNWEEIKRLKAGGKREYQRIIEEHLKKVYWQGYEAGIEEREEENR